MEIRREIILINKLWLKRFHYKLVAAAAEVDKIGRLIGP
jgi:hypothetical protein